MPDAFNIKSSLVIVAVAVGDIPQEYPGCSHRCRSGSISFPREGQVQADGK